MSEAEEPLTPELRAAEYVLGTLAPDECARFEAQMAQDDQVRREVAYWEQRLGTLGLAAPPVQPPPLVWTQVQARTRPAVPAKRNPNSGLWIGAAVAASMAAFALGVLMSVGLQPEPGVQSTPAPVYASLIQDDKRDLSWLVTADSKPANKLQIVAMGDSYGKAWAGRSLQLWLLAPGANPISLGLLPKEGVSNVKVAPEVATALTSSGAEGLKLAVSNEPLGGSPTGAPTGEVLYVAALNQRTPFLH